VFFEKRFLYLRPGPETGAFFDGLFTLTKEKGSFIIKKCVKKSGEKWFIVREFKNNNK